MAALCACALVPRRTLRLSRASIQLPEPPRLRRQPRVFSAISRGVSRVGTGAVGSAACGDTNRGVSGVGGGRELRGRRQAAARTPLSRPRLASPGRTLDASPSRPGAMRENTKSWRKDGHRSCLRQPPGRRAASSGAESSQQDATPLSQEVRGAGLARQGQQGQLPLPGALWECWMDSGLRRWEVWVLFVSPSCWNGSWQQPRVSVCGTSSSV